MSISKHHSRNMRLKTEIDEIAPNGKQPLIPPKQLDYNYLRLTLDTKYSIRRRVLKDDSILQFACTCINLIFNAKSWCFLLNKESFALLYHERKILKKDILKVKTNETTTCFCLWFGDRWNKVNCIYVCIATDQLLSLLPLRNFLMLRFGYLNNLHILIHSYIISISSLLNTGIYHFILTVFSSSFGSNTA